jgi:hypothetical protein
MLEWDTTNAYRILAGKHLGKCPLEDENWKIKVQMNAKRNL